MKNLVGKIKTLVVVNSCGIKQVDDCEECEIYDDYLDDINDLY